MKLPSPRFVPFLASFIFFFSTTSPALASDDRDEREVRIVSVQGDVRLSRGGGKRTDLKKPWEQAQSGEFIEQGFALATGVGRAEIEFENGSTVYLAENSLLLFRDLSASGDRIVSRLTLATGTASFTLQPVAGESFFIETPTEHLSVTAPQTFFARIDAYLDASAITPQGTQGESLHRHGMPNRQIGKGETLFLQGGEIIEPPVQPQSGSASKASDFISAQLSAIESESAPLRASGLSPLIPGGLILQSLSNFQRRQNGNPFSQGSNDVQSPPNSPLQLTHDWDTWVSARVQQKSAVIADALTVSGLASPIPGLVDLYEHGSFFQCAPYGTCWKPAQREAQEFSSSQASTPMAQSPAPNQASTGFSPQTVEWLETYWGPCGSYSSRRVSRVARTPQELDELLRLKAEAERRSMQQVAYSDDCYSQTWIPYNRSDDCYYQTGVLYDGCYAMVVTPLVPRTCSGKKCKPVHPPRPIWVRVGNKVGFVPRHPRDVKGKPPINLKNGIIVPPSRPGQPAQRVAFDPSHKVKILDKAPAQFQRGPSSHAPAVSAPEIHAHLIQEFARNNSLLTANHAAPKIAYDYKSQKFVMGDSRAPGAKSKEIAIGGIASNGRVGSFADGHSGRYSESFGRSSAAASYSGTIRSPGLYSSGSYSSGGGHSPGSYSSGSHSSSSYSSASNSSGGSSSHYSTGGGGSSSTSSSSSANSSGASGGRPHP